MPPEQFWNVTSSGLYRISQTDASIADPSLRYAVRVAHDKAPKLAEELRDMIDAGKTRLSQDASGKLVTADDAEASRITAGGQASMATTRMLPTASKAATAAGPST